MPVCTFFGHRDCPDTIKPQLREVLNDLIANHGVTVFYVGHQGRFDAIVRGVLGQLQKVATPEAFVEKMKYEPHQKGDILLISGIGKVYPFMRSHKILDNIQHIFADIPVLMLYPGSFDGQDLDLFGKFLDGHYYRAFNLL